MSEATFVEAFVRSCQELAGFVAESRHLEASTALERLACGLSPDLPIGERPIVHRLLIQAIGKVVAATLCQSVCSNISSSDWCSDLRAVSTAVAAAIGSAVQRSDRPGARDVRVERALAVIAARYTDPDLSQQEIARASRISMFHLSHLVKQQTGCTINEHIHARRVGAARDLLLRTRLSVKEIAARVGYRSDTQLGRHFRPAHGMSPVAFRSSSPPVS